MGVVAPLRGITPQTSAQPASLEVKTAPTSPRATPRPSLSAAWRCRSRGSIASRALRTSSSAEKAFLYMWMTRSMSRASN